MNHHISELLTTCLGQEKKQHLVSLMHISAFFDGCELGKVNRAELAQSLNMILFDGVLERVPTGNAYTQDVSKTGGKVMLDHGALRTVRWFGLGELPPGEAAITRVLKPLGFQLNGLFPLDKLKMTGRSYCHMDDPENISQFFVSELHPEKFSHAFQTAVTNVLGSSIDPLTPQAISMLNELERDGYLSVEQAKQLMPILVACFQCQHATPTIADYETLIAESAEMAWIATEGNMFNHATDRVEDVFAVSDYQKQLGRPMKPNVEISGNGRVRQTAFKADPVMRKFIATNGDIIERQVPGSFYEFITRDNLPNEKSDMPAKLDLGFDTGNATGIFKMTANSN
jgi:hypothetical protein